MVDIDVSVSVDIEDYLDEVSDSNLLDELTSRHLSKKQKAKLYDMFSEEIRGDFNIPKNMTIIDEQKLNLFLENFNKITLEQLNTII